MRYIYVIGVLVTMINEALGRKPRALRVERASEKASLDKRCYKEDNRPQLTDRLVTVTGSYVGLRRECIQRTIRQCTALAAIDGERDPLVIYHR